MIDDLNCRLIEPSRGRVGIAYFYADYRDRKAQTLHHILGSLLRQLLFHFSNSILGIPEQVRDTLEGMRKNGRHPSQDEMLKLLQITLQNFARAFICIDAWDELEADTRSQVLQKIGLLVACDNLRVFLTGRKHIQPEVQKLSKSSVEIVANSNDIRAYLRKKIEDDGNPESMDEALQNEIVASLVAQSQDMYVIISIYEIFILTLYL